MPIPRHHLLRIGVAVILLGLIGAAVAVFVLLGGRDSGRAASRTGSPAASVARTPGASPADASSAPQPSVVLPPADGGLASVDERVAFWEARVAASETDYLSTLNLIDAYLDRVRATGDLSDLARAETALERARELAPRNDVGLLLRSGQVAFTLHDFAGARAAAEEALVLDPGLEPAVALLGDSALELGDEDTARDAYAELAAEGATAPVLSRLARHDLLTGEVDAAEAQMRQAIEVAVTEGFADQIAFYRYQLAELLRGENRVGEAAAEYEAVLEAVPDHVPALGGLARIREAQGRRDEAVELLEQATARIPTPQLVADLGDLHALDGDEEAASASYALVERIAEVAQATGGVYDRALTVFLADHERRIDDAVALAMAEIALRTDVYGYDALAWALYRAGHLEEADAAAAQALRYDTRDGRILYHAGLIAAALGRDDEARDLLTRASEHEAALPPLQVPELRAALDALGT